MILKNVWNDPSGCMASGSRRHLNVHWTLDVIHINFSVFGISYSFLNLNNFERCRIPWWLLRFSWVWVEGWYVVRCLVIWNFIHSVSWKLMKGFCIPGIWFINKYQRQQIIHGNALQISHHVDAVGCTASGKCSEWP
jgi:hypothetical protein